MSQVTAVCVLHTLLPEPTNPDGVTAIDKRPVPTRVPVGPVGLSLRAPELERGVS